VKLAIYLHLVSRFRVSGDTPPLPPYDLMAFTRTTIPLFDLTLQNFEVTVVTRKSKPALHTVGAHVIIALLADEAEDKNREM
jgi:hypothetical protein